MTLPAIHEIDKIVFPEPEKISLQNNIPLFGFNGTKNDILRIDLIFNAGRWTETLPLQSSFVASLFKSGTSKYTSFEINEMIDSLGSTLKSASGFNSFTVSIYCMNRYLEQTLSHAILCLNECIFPEQELEHQKRKSLANLSLSLEKNDYLADNAFKKQIFGNTHPYGYETTREKIEQLTREHLLHYYQQELCPAKCTVFIAGKYGQDELKILDRVLGGWNKENRNGQADAKAIPAIPAFERNVLHIKKEKSVQASIVIGNVLFNKQHDDYAAFVLLNTIFGGYFGSRLMSNIREEKGLTYGIHSGLFTMKHAGLFSIQTDTNLENVEVCLREIYLEMDRLQNERIPEAEITLARNYLLGKFLGRTDGPFNQAEVFKSYRIENVNIHKFSEIVETLRQTDAVSLQRLAQQYLRKENMLEVAVG
jgi:zinc protease